MSEAAPAIRHALVERVASAHEAGEALERLRELDVATGLAQALRILTEAADAPLAPGIADEEGLPPGAVQQAREWLRADADDLLGPAEAVGGQGTGRVAAPSEADLPRPAEGRDVHDL